MQVDRARFLFLTTAIAAASCGRAGPAQSPSQDESGNGDPSGPTVIALDPGGEQEPEPEVLTTVSNDDSASAPANLEAICRSLEGPPGPSCESIDQTPKDCLLYERTLKPIPAEQATRCLANKSGRQAICDFKVAMDCFIQGTRTATKLPAADQPCRTIVSACGRHRHRRRSMTMDDCRAAHSAVKPEYQSQLISCMTESCGLGGCMYYLE